MVSTASNGDDFFESQASLKSFTDSIGNLYNGVNGAAESQSGMARMAAAWLA